MISSISTSVLDWSIYPAISDVNLQNFDINDVGYISSATVNTDDLFFISSVGKKLVVSTLNGNTAFFSSLSNNDRIFTNRLWTNNVSTGSVSTLNLKADNILTSSIRGNTVITSTLNANLISSVNGNIFNLSSVKGNISSLAVSSLTGSYANNVSSQLAVLSNFSTTFNPTAYSNWSLYPARSNVNFAGYSANNINTVNTGATNTNSLVVGGGGQIWNGNAQFNGTGNTFQPYWYTFIMDANTQTANAGTIYCPTNNQYFSDWFVATNVLDPESIFSGFAFTTTKLHTYTAGAIIPTGYIDFRAHNYRSIPILPPITAKDYRGQLYLGTEGSGANAYIGINYDSFESVYNVGTSIILNADSVGGSILAGFSRITSQSARNQMLGTVQTQIYTGYLGVDPAYTFYAGFEQQLLNSEGGGATQTMRSRGADVLGFPGSRTDITSECPENTSVPSQMNIYSSQSGNLYTDGDFYIGYGGSVPRYGYNSDQQKIHIINTNDIQGITTTGVTITNVNSVQGLNSNSFIQNIHYLVGYDTDVTFDINFLEFPREIRSTIDFKYSTIELFSTVFVSSINQNITFSTLSSIVFAASSYTSSFMLNQTNVSSFKTNINSFNVNKFNEILGISTILSSFIINVDKASIKEIDKVSSLTASNISSQLLYVSDIKGGYSSNVSSSIGNINFNLSNLSSYVSTNKFNVSSISSFVTSNVALWANYPAVSSFSMNSNTIYNISNAYFNKLNLKDVYIGSNYTVSYTGANTITVGSNTFPQLSYFPDGGGILRYIPQDWSFYDAENNVSMNNYDINNISSVNALNVSTTFMTSQTGIFSTLTASNISTNKIYNSSITTEEIILQNSTSAFMYINDTNGNFLGGLGRAEGQDNTIILTSISTLYLIGQDCLIQATSNAGIVGENTVIGATSTIAIESQNLTYIRGSNGIILENNTGITNGSLFLYSTLQMNNNTIYDIDKLVFSTTTEQYVERVDGVDYMNINAPLKTYNFNYISNTGGNNPGVVFQYSNLIDGSLTLNSSNRFVMSKPLDVNEISSGSLVVNNFIGNSISTNNISTGNLFVNNSVENSISSLRTSTGNLFSGVISSIQFNASSINANRAFINNLTGSGSATNTTNLYPQSAGAQIGFFGSGGTNSGGFYGQVNARSTLTQVIVPDIVGAFSNNIRIQGNVSTQNVFVSTINRKQYPTRSTIGGPFFPSSFTIDGSVSATPQLLISSINFFAGPGNYDISQRMAFIKLTGGTSVDAHGSILVMSTNTLSAPDSNAGYGQVPQVNDSGHSTFTTMYTSITVGTNSFQRQYKYLDATGGNYTGSLYLERPVITYIPSQGINPE